MVQHARSRPSAPSTTDHAAERIQHLYNVSWEPRTASDAQSRPRNITEETELLLDSVRAFNKTIEGNRAHDHHNPSYCRPSAIAFTTILLRSMYDFSAVNAIYSTLFNAPNPPARVTVACGECMPPEVNVMMSFLYHDVPTTQRDGLHVQSRSYWAPANIGPYSQALSVPVSESATRGDARVDEPDPQDIRGRIVYVAGQIPLVPATMQLVSDSFIEQAVLSLQHLWRIGRAMHVHLWANITVYIIASSHEKAQERAVIAGELWRSMHRREASAMDDEDGDEDVDIGDAHLYRSMGRTGLGKQDFDKVNRSPLPDWNRIQVEKTVDPSSREESISPPCAIVQVAELPRNAAIEWAGVGCIAGEDRKIRLVGDTVEVESLSITTEILNKHTSKSEGSTTEYYVKYGHENEDLDGMIVPCRAVFDGYGNEHVAMARRWQQCDERPAEKPTA